MKILSVILLLLIAEHTLATTHCDNECQRALIEDYYDKLNRTLTSETNTIIIDEFLNSLHTDITYLHEEYATNYDKSQWKEALLRQKSLGRYANTVSSETTIETMIHGYQTAAVKAVRRYRTIGDSGIASTPARLAIFKFKDNKIVFVQDHWYHAVE